jgi:hypothetical protein
VKDKTEFQKFDEAMKKVLKVSHDEIKAKLDAEKKMKTESKKRKQK